MIDKKVDISYFAAKLIFRRQGGIMQ